MAETMPSSLSILGLGMTRPYTPEATLELGGVALQTWMYQETGAGGN